MTREFAAVLADVVAPRPVFLWDERFSTADAKIRIGAASGARRTCRRRGSRWCIYLGSLTSRQCTEETSLAMQTV